MKRIVPLLMLLLIACEPKITSEKFDNISGLEKYLNLPFTPIKGEYEVVTDNIGPMGQDCRKMIKIYAVLEFSEENYKKSIESMKGMGIGYDISILKKDYRVWYPDSAKDIFIEEDDTFFRLATESYKANNLVNKNIKGGCFVIPLKENKICYDITFCAEIN